MKRINKYLAVGLMLIGFSFTGVNAQSFSGRTAAPSRTLEQQIFRELIRLPRYGVFDHISYQVDGSTVILNGKVLSLGTRKSAERVVRRIPGVQQVVNNIRELPLSSFDNQIRRQLLREFTRTPALYMYLREPNPSVRLIVENGRVTLEGFVNNRGTANTMNILAHGIPGVFSVRNNLIIENDRNR